MRLPSGQLVDQETPIYPGSFFTWGEATKNLARPLQDKELVQERTSHGFEFDSKPVSSENEPISDN